MGQMILKSEPWAYISIDGKETGLITSARPLRVAAGSHQIDLENPALGLKQSFTIEVRPDETVRRFVRLE